MFRGCLSNKEINCKTRKLQRKRKQNKITYKLGEITYLIWGRNSVICSDFWGRNSDSSHREHVSKLDWRRGEICHVSRAEWRKRAGTGQSERQLSRAESNWAWYAVTRDHLGQLSRTERRTGCRLQTRVPRGLSLGRALVLAWRERAL